MALTYSQYGGDFQGRCHSRFVLFFWCPCTGYGVTMYHMLTCSRPGADSRTTTGAYIANRVTDKLTRVHDTIWCCRSGSAADTQAVADIVQYQLGLFAMQSGKPPMTQTAASIFQEICYANKDRLS
jgi:hypothetical protein